MFYKFSNEELRLLAVGTEGAELANLRATLIYWGRSLFIIDLRYEGTEEPAKYLSFRKYK